MPKRITDLEVEQIYIELREGTHPELIANEFGVSTVFIRKLNYGERRPQPGMMYPIVIGAQDEAT